MDPYYRELLTQWQQLKLVCSSVRMIKPHAVVYPVSTDTWYVRLGTTSQHVLLRYHDGSLEVADTLPRGKHVAIHVATPEFEAVLSRCTLVSRMVTYSKAPEDVITWLLTGQLCDITLPTHPVILHRQVTVPLIQAFMRSV